MPVAKSTLKILSLTVLLSAGCVRQDTEILTRVGRKLADKTQASTAGLREKMPFRLAAASAEPTLADRVQQRFTTDKLLATTPLDVQANGADVELKGTVDRDEQKRRAVDLAETTQGVERVMDGIQVRGEKNPEN